MFMSFDQKIITGPRVENGNHFSQIFLAKPQPTLEHFKHFEAALSEKRHFFSKNISMGIDHEVAKVPHFFFHNLISNLLFSNL